MVCFRTQKVESSCKISKWPPAHFTHFHSFLSSTAACVQRNKIVSPGVQLSPAAPAPAPGCQWTEQQLSVLWAEQSESPAHLHPPTSHQRDLRGPPLIITPCPCCCSGGEKVLLTILLREVSQCPERVSQLHLY